jgi:hypothetical protein
MQLKVISCSHYREKNNRFTEFMGLIEAEDNRGRGRPLPLWFHPSPLFSSTV